MNFGVVLIAAAGFLLGGAYSMTRLENDCGGKGPAQFAVAGVLIALAGYLIVAGIIQFGRE